ncbi:hypothetical protein BDR05DRAFT_950988 [Suillus weaverae]|nr:hypothetical protein BDR05DRAFT_950988 [Suillus weaverae]
MGRPQLHKTEEAWLEAACRSNCKYYEKNKKEIGLKMAMNYCHKRDNTTKSKHRDFTSASMAPKYDIEDAQSNLVVISAKLKPLCIKMGYLQTLDSDSHPNASDSGCVVAAGVMCRSKVITMATEKLWCYSATREMDEEMNPKFLHRVANTLNKVESTMSKLISSKNTMPASNIQSMSIKKWKKPLWEVQDKFLQTLSAEYFRIWDDKDHTVFFNNLYACFFAHWPEEERLFPGVTQLSGEQAIAIACSVKRHKKVVYTIVTH